MWSNPQWPRQATFIAVPLNCLFPTESLPSDWVQFFSIVLGELLPLKKLRTTPYQGGVLDTKISCQVSQNLAFAVSSCFFVRLTLTNGVSMGAVAWEACFPELYL